jgi:hypothetical protein
VRRLEVSSDFSGIDQNIFRNEFRIIKNSREYAAVGSKKNGAGNVIMKFFL